MIYNWTPKARLGQGTDIDYGITVDGVYYGSSTNLYNLLGDNLEGCLESNPANGYMSVGRVLSKEQKEYLHILCDRLSSDIESFRKRLDCY